MLGVLTQTSTSSPPVSSSEYYKRIIDFFPQSPYAEAARKNLGYATSGVDPAEILYEEAERYLDADDYNRAIAIFEKIEKEHPLSPHASKSAYARAWVYEHKLKNYDSASVIYKYIRNRYTGSTYATLAKRMILDSTEIPIQVVDTIRTQQKTIPRQGERETPILYDEKQRSLKERQRRSKEETQMRDPKLKYSMPPKQTSEEKEQPPKDEENESP